MLKRLFLLLFFIFPPGKAENGVQFKHMEEKKEKAKLTLLHDDKWSKFKLKLKVFPVLDHETALFWKAARAKENMHDLFNEIETGEGVG